VDDDGAARGEILQAGSSRVSIWLARIVTSTRSPGRAPLSRYTTAKPGCE